MAQAVSHLPLSRAVGWLLRPPPAVRYGLKLGTSMAAGIWIAFASAQPWSLTIWITVMFVSQPNVGASIKKGLTRICGSVASALISIAIYGLFAQQPPLMFASICGVLALAVYGMTGPRYSYAWLVFGFTTIIILVKAMAGSDQIETLAFERASLTALGVLIVYVADALFWPVRAEEQLRASLAERSRHLGGTLKQQLENPSSEQAPGKPVPPPSSPLIQHHLLLDQLRVEIGVTPARAQAFSRIALLLEGLASRVRLLERESRTESNSPAPTMDAALAQLGIALDAALAKASRAFSTDDAPEPFAEALEHPLASFESERMAHPDAARSALAPVLQDVVLLLRSLEEALLSLVKRGGEPEAGTASEAAPVPIVERFRVDPIRLQLALRAGIAGGGVIIAMLAMGWSFEEDLLPMILAPIVAFILAGMSATRGAATTIAIGLTAGVLLGWLIADLSMVFLFAHLDRMPLSLVYPFAVAGGAGYLIVRGSPFGPLGTLFGMLTALLPVFIGDAPPQDVDESYGLVCGLLLGTAAGVIAQRLFWPRTAMQSFTERAAAQLDLCQQALGERGTEDGPDRDAAALVGAYAKQLTLLGHLHAQAHREPVERALDDGRRGELLSLTQVLFDASLRERRTATTDEAGVPSDAEAALAPLRNAVVNRDAAILSSMAATAQALRSAAPAPGPGLLDAQASVDAQIDELRDRIDVSRPPDPRRTAEFFAQVAASRRLVECQLQIETWLADWRRATGPPSASM